MTAKDKAKELHKSFMEIQTPYEDNISGTIEESDMDWGVAKACAIKCAEEIISDMEGIPDVPFWKEVITELNKL